jgi:peptidoglycan-associated lipoprotein
MLRFTHLKAAAVFAATGLSVVACHGKPPEVASVARPVNDDAARLARARSDSIARADAARRAADARAAARADSLRRAADAARAAEADVRTRLLAPIHFDFDRSEIRLDDRGLLDQKASILMANHAIRIRIDGNTDERGSDEYNLALGMRRAAETRRYLVERGIDSTRIAIVSNGEERQLCREADESCWSQNRRAEFTLTAGGERITAGR